MYRIDNLLQKTFLKHSIPLSSVVERDTSNKLQAIANGGLWDVEVNRSSRLEGKLFALLWARFLPSHSTLHVSRSVLANWQGLIFFFYALYALFCVHAGTQNREISYRGKRIGAATPGHVVAS